MTEFETQISSWRRPSSLVYRSRRFARRMLGKLIVSCRETDPEDFTRPRAPHNRGDVYPMEIDRAACIQRACQLVADGDVDGAAQLLLLEYPFVPVHANGRRYTASEATAIFVRDGFIDRYRGGRLVFPAALRLLSHYLPQSLPFQTNWKMSACHFAYWELCPTIDHVDPVALGGIDSATNWMTCSMLTNSMKSNWTLEQLQWKLKPPGLLQEWDGLLGWFTRQVASDPAVLQDPYIKRWHDAARRVRA